MTGRKERKVYVEGEEGTRSRVMDETVAGWLVKIRGVKVELDPCCKGGQGRTYRW